MISNRGMSPVRPPGFENRHPMTKLIAREI